ncbi:transglycosylase SLT domain-containing protein [Candidatus Saccharibacteria bacterium]|nr:transglycosylase SLT domain-containing protein [Candidatus Saccharibacteria bacterium]
MQLKYGSLRLLKRLSKRDWLMLASGAAIVGLLWGLISWMDRPPTPLAAKKDSRVSIPWLPDTVKRWEDIFNEMGRKYNINPNLLAIITTLESGGYTKAVSPADAQGLMQVTPPTAKDIARKYLQEPRDSYDLTDPHTNIEFGAAYLAFLRDEFGEPSQGPSWDYTVELIAAGYNGGLGAAGKLYRGEGLTSSETVVYSRDAFNMWRERHAKTSPTFDRWLERGGQRLIDQAREEQEQSVQQ